MLKMTNHLPMTRTQTTMFGNILDRINKYFCTPKNTVTEALEMLCKKGRNTFP